MYIKTKFIVTLTIYAENATRLRKCSHLYLWTCVDYISGLSVSKAQMPSGAKLV